MIKEQFQQELLEKVKPGTKPSTLKKSKSTGDLPAINPPLTNQPRRSSINPVINPESLTHQLKKAQDEVSALGLQVEIQGRELTEFKEENEHLKEQAKLKQKELEGLRKDKENLTQQIIQLEAQLGQVKDQVLETKHQNLKDWYQEYEKCKKAENELDEIIEESSEKLINQDKQIANLQTQVIKLSQEKQSLTKDLDLAYKLVELRKTPLPLDDFSQSLTYFKYVLYALLTVWFLMILRRKDV